MSTLEIVAGWASVLGFLFVVVGFAWKMSRSYQRSRRAAEETLEDELARLRAAGGTSVGRADLGFLVLVELSWLSVAASGFWHLANAALAVAATSVGVWAVIVFLPDVLNVGTATPSSAAWWAMYGFGATCVALWLVALSYAFRFTKYVALYRRRVGGVWKDAVAKRTGNSDPAP